ncbi:GAF domain-containing protein [Terriglobus saanensis]|uniref:GAF domain protein n=1 Tax=Terriglobus saanensis (strain ATCC BAA-1853 / DSM 23119 / SP1PR4) TaxID=401053 RepID=E8V326_TERSS|nr:GAF domain-containing protein [Terriglobus saanensis]ADV81301.1 GAF domain protein [Terriglobus saanensis SP1PR4]
MREHQTFVPAALPSNESERLSALAAYRIMDSQDEPQFDQLTRLGAYAFHVPLCLITFISEHRQFLKSAYGTPRRESSRRDSFCSYSLLQDDPLVVLDTSQDPRFASNPHVQTETPLLFYAGTPLVSKEGLKIGTFCIFDFTPRESFEEKDRKALVDFASLAMELVEERLLPMQLAQAEAKTLNSSRNSRQILESVEESVFLLDKDWNLIFLTRMQFGTAPRAVMCLGKIYGKPFPDW